MRPYCYEFLKNMSELYNIYIFTSAKADYAESIVSYLNKRENKTISGVLNRRNCFKTNNGSYFKDLRIIKNRPLNNIIMVDNRIHSFGLQLDNGIPILGFKNDKKDRELFGIEPLLKKAATVDDVRSLFGLSISLKTNL